MHLINLFCSLIASIEALEMSNWFQSMGQIGLVWFGSHGYIYAKLNWQDRTGLNSLTSQHDKILRTIPTLMMETLATCAMFLA